MQLLAFNAGPADATLLWRMVRSVISKRQGEMMRMNKQLIAAAERGDTTEVLRMLEAAIHS